MNIYVTVLEIQGTYFNQRGDAVPVTFIGPLSVQQLIGIATLTPVLKDNKIVAEIQFNRNFMEEADKDLLLQVRNNPDWWGYSTDGDHTIKELTVGPPPAKPVINIKVVPK